MNTLSSFNRSLNTFSQNLVSKEDATVHAALTLLGISPLYVVPMIVFNAAKVIAKAVAFPFLALASLINGTAKEHKNQIITDLKGEGNDVGQLKLLGYLTLILIPIVGLIFSPNLESSTSKAFDADGIKLRNSLNDSNQKDPVYELSQSYHAGDMTDPFSV
jgi:hypothetical protein